MLKKLDIHFFTQKNDQAYQETEKIDLSIGKEFCS